MTETATAAQPDEASLAPTQIQQTPAIQKTKIEKAHSYLGLVSTTLGIVGAVGTAFCWIATTFFEGQVEIRPDKPVEAVLVKVMDNKGQQSIYYNRFVSLLPGDYHLEFGVPDKKPTKHADVHVELWKQSVIPFVVPPELVQPEKIEKKKWWQFWKRDKSKVANPAARDKRDGSSPSLTNQ